MGANRIIMVRTGAPQARVGAGMNAPQPETFTFAGDALVIAKKLARSSGQSLYVIPVTNGWQISPHDHARLGQPIEVMSSGETVDNSDRGRFVSRRAAA